MDLSYLRTADRTTSKSASCFAIFTHAARGSRKTAVRNVATSSRVRNRVCLGHQAVTVKIDQSVVKTLGGFRSRHTSLEPTRRPSNIMLKTLVSALIPHHRGIGRQFEYDLLILER